LHSLAQTRDQIQVRDGGQIK